MAIAWKIWNKEAVTKNTLSFCLFECLMKQYIQKKIATWEEQRKRVFKMNMTDEYDMTFDQRIWQLNLKLRIEKKKEFV